MADTGVSDGVNSDKVLYLDAKPTVETKGGYEATVYLMDGTKEDVVVDNDSAVGFYTYDINKDGVYELGAIPGNVNVTGSNYDGETGVIADNVIVSIRRSQYITFTTAKLENITLSEDLQVVDVRSGRENHAYTQKITDLSKLEAAMDRGAVTAMAYVDDGEVKLISVTAMADTRSSDNTVASAKAVKAEGAGAGLTVTEAAEVDNTEHTIKVTVGGTATNGDKITVTATATDSEAAVSGTATLTYTTGWSEGTITVTAENGAPQAYTVSVKLDKSTTPTIDTDLSEPTVYVKKGGSATPLTVAASGATNPTYQWQKKGAGDAEFGDIEGATSASYTPAGAEAGTTQYRCLVYDKTDAQHEISDAATSKTATVAVIDVAAGNLTGTLTNNTNNVLTVSHDVTNIEDGSTVTLKWYANGSNTGANDNNKPANATVVVTENGKVANGKIIFTLTEDGSDITAETEYFYGVEVNNLEFRFSITTPETT